MRSPNGKAELLNRLFSYDFNGDWRTLGDRVSINRIRPHVAQLHFPETGRVFEVVVRIPRGPEAKAHKAAPPNVMLKEVPAPPAAPVTQPKRRKEKAERVHH